MSDNSKVTIHMVSSLDGFIAKGDGSVDWMHSEKHYEKGKVLKDEDIMQFLASVDCYVMGSKTYETALQLGWPYGDKPVYVATRRDLPVNTESVHLFDEDLTGFMPPLRRRYQSIWMVGGAALTRDFLRRQLADELVVSIMPVLLGEGTLFFDFIGTEQRLHLKDSTAYSDGMVELTYRILK